MRAISIISVSFLIIAMGVSGFILQKLAESPLPPLSEAEIESAVLAFQSTHEPTHTLEFEKLRQELYDRELSQPELRLPHYHLYPAKEIAELNRYEKSCEKSDFKFRSLKGVKAYLWQQKICGEIIRLPKSFLITPPYMHFSGHSYAWLIHKNEKNLRFFNFTNEKLTEFLHLTERGLIGRDSSKLHEILARLTASEFDAISSQDLMVTSRNWVFILKSGPSNDFAEAIYQVYPRGSINQYFNERSVDVFKPAIGQNCIYENDTTCWKAFKRDLTLPIVIASLSLVIFFGTQLLLFLGRRKKRLLEHERQKFILRTLAHELRTPTTSLQLSQDQMRKDFNSFSDRTRELFLRQCSDVGRLRRVIEASQQYLRTTDSEKLLDINPYPIENLYEFASDIADGHSEIELDNSLKDTDVKTDPYWLGICLRNLIENSCKHGLAPIVVSSQKKNGRCQITVKDAGTIARQDAKKLMTPFTKGESSSGLGLGLSIVKQVAESLGGQLRIQLLPTRFILEVEDHR